MDARRFVNMTMLIGALLLLAGATATPAVAQLGLPPSYDVQTITGTNPVLGAAFGDSATSAGDLNGDGEEDILTYQLPGSPNSDGEVYIISGETGALLDTIVAPDPGNAAPAPPGGVLNNAANFAFPWMSKLGTNQGSSAATYTDLGSCPGATTATVTCPGAVGAPDGIPEILIGARGVDANGFKDAGRAYVFDGSTRALLKKIDMPAAESGPAVARGTSALRAGGPWFGRAVLNPAGQPGCAGNSSVGPCQPVPRSVQIGDLDGAGRPDIVVGASATTESTGSPAAGGTAHPGSQCAGTAPGTFCSAAGRVYLYRGEDIVGSSPAEILDGSGANETVRQLKNLDAQGNPGGTELFGNSLAAIGDVGRCTNTGIAAGEPCPDAASTNVPDGRPEVVIGALRVDIPVTGAGGANMDAGVSYLMDGATGTILRTYEHPQPQNTTVFGSQFQVPAAGDLGDTALPDAYIPAAAQDLPGAPAGGKGYVMNGNFKAGNLLLSEIEDPTPHEAENFGYASVGVGDLVGGAANPRNELLVASEGPFFSDRGPTDPAAPPPPNDLHFFNGATGRVLQTIKAPSTQPGSAFGQAVTGLGDLNEDGYLDFAVGAPLFNNPGGSGEGRLYIFRSRRPAPPVRYPPPPASGCVAGTSTGVSCVRNAQGGLTITGTAGANRIVGSSGRDVIRCGAGDDVVLAGPGDDEIRCGAGDDAIEAGTGDDLADGEAGDDKVAGEPGRDRLLGGAGADRGRGGAGNDTLDGGAGNDRLDGEGGNDRGSGGGGRDRLGGGSGNDSLAGGSGGDRLTAGGGRNRLSGGSGNDRLNTRNRRRGDSANCGESRRDRDRATVDRGDRVRGCERVRR